MEENVILKERSKKWKKVGIGIFVAFLIICAGIGAALGVIIWKKGWSWPKDYQENIAVLVGPALTALMCFAFGLSIFVAGKKMATWSEYSKEKLQRSKKSKSIAGAILLVLGIIAFIGIIFVFLFYTKIITDWIADPKNIIALVLVGGIALGWILAIVGGTLLFNGVAASEALLCLSKAKEAKEIEQPKVKNEPVALTEKPAKSEPVASTEKPAKSEPVVVVVPTVQPINVIQPAQPVQQPAPAAQPAQQVVDPADQVTVTEPVESETVETEEIIEEIIEEPVQQPVQAEPVVQPTPAPAVQPVQQPIQQPAPATQPVQQPVQAESVVQPTPAPVVQPAQQVVVEEIIEDDEQAQQVAAPVEETVISEPVPAQVVKKIIRRKIPVQQPKVIEEIIEEVDDDGNPVLVRKIKRVRKVAPRRRPNRKRTIVRTEPDLAQTIAQLQNVVSVPTPVKRIKKRTPAKKPKNKKSVIKNIATNKDGDITITISKQ